MKKIGYLTMFIALVMVLAIIGCIMTAIWIDGPKSTENNFILTAAVLFFPTVILAIVGNAMIDSSETR